MIGWRCVSEKRSGATATALEQYHTLGRLFNVHNVRENIMENKRTRNFATVVYPESAPNDWKMILQEQCVPAFISPLHDRDFNTDKTRKKKHYHVMIMFDGVKTREQAGEVFAMIGGVGIEPIKCVKAYARYLCHLDNPDKAKYVIEDVISCAGADYSYMISATTDRYTAIGEMIEFCIENTIVGYAELLLYAKNNRTDWFRVLCDSGTVTMVQFLKSHYWELTKSKRNTGD